MRTTDYNLPIFEDTDMADLNNYTSNLASALKTQIDRFGNPLTFKGVVATLNDLPEDAAAGDIYNVTTINKNYVYSGTAWLEYSDAIDNSCQNMISDEYDSAQTYAVGNYCIKDNKLYKCIENTTGNWDLTKWTETQISQELNHHVVVDNLNSTSTTDALSANQGKVLNEKMFPMEILANNYNIDNIKKSGFYGIFNATGTLPTGYSTSDNNIFIESIMWSSDFGRQILHDVRTKNTYIRNLSANSWHLWSQIV